MRFAHVLKPRPRSVGLAALFGAMVALTVPLEIGPVQAQEQKYEDHECKDPRTCENFTFPGWCMGGANCKGEPVEGEFYTCTPGGVIFCINDGGTYGWVQCPGRCQNQQQSQCSFPIYKCK